LFGRSLEALLLGNHDEIKQPVADFLDTVQAVSTVDEERNRFIASNIQFSFQREEELIVLTVPYIVLNNGANAGKEALDFREYIRLKNTAFITTRGVEKLYENRGIAPVIGCKAGGHPSRDQEQRQADTCD
jgi:hypothetical protein